MYKENITQFQNDIRTVPAVWYNNVQEEICSLMEAGGVPFDVSNTQLKEQIDRIINQGGAPKEILFAHLDEREVQVPDWTPFDSGPFKTIQFLITIVLKNINSDLRDYLTVHQSFIFHRGKWIGLGVDYFSERLCRIDDQGRLFVHLGNSLQRTGITDFTATEDDFIEPHSLIFTHLERTLKVAHFRDYDLTANGRAEIQLGEVAPPPIPQVPQADYDAMKARRDEIQERLNERNSLLSDIKAGRRCPSGFPL